MARVWAVWAVIGWHKQAEMEFRCRNDVDLEPKEPKIDNQCGLSQINAIRASDIWRGRLKKEKQSKGYTEHCDSLPV